MGTCSGSLGRYHRRPGGQRARVTGRIRAGGDFRDEGKRGREPWWSEVPGAQGPRARGCGGSDARGRGRSQPAASPPPRPRTLCSGSAQPGPVAAVPDPAGPRGAHRPGSRRRRPGLAARSGRRDTCGHRVRGGRAGRGREAGGAGPRGREAGQSSERTRGCGERDSEPKEGGAGLGGKERCSPLLTNQRKGKGRRSRVPGLTWRHTSACLGGLSLSKPPPTQRAGRPLPSFRGGRSPRVSPPSLY